MLSLHFARTRGRKIFVLEFYDRPECLPHQSGMWCVFNFIPGRLGVYVEVRRCHDRDGEAVGRIVDNRYGGKV